MNSTPFPQCKHIRNYDALPIKEVNAFDYRSKVEGKMHGYGHDGHSTMPLGAAHQLTECGKFEGIVVFIFQPNEEHGLGDQAMIDDGLYHFPTTEVYGMHNLPGLEEGVLAIYAGAIVASENLFEIRITDCGSSLLQHYDFNDNILEIDARYWATLVEQQPQS